MKFFKKKKKKDVFLTNWKIKKNCLEMIFESAKSSYPNEFGALLRVDDNQRNTITELVLLPGTISGDAHAIFRMHMLPIDFSIVGTVHSHPSPHPFPSEADKDLFRKHGKIHIIVAYPYNMSSFRAYDYNGENVDLEIV